MAGFVDNSGAQRVVLYGSNGVVNPTLTVDTELPAAAAANDGTGNPTAPAVIGYMMAYEGNWSRIRMANDTMPIGNNSRTGVTSGDQNSWNMRAVLMTLDITSNPDLNTIQLSFEMKLNSGTYVRIWTATTPQSAVGKYVYAFGPSVSTTGTTFVEAVQIPLMKNWRIVATYVGATNAFYAVYLNWCN